MDQEASQKKLSLKENNIRYLTKKGHGNNFKFYSNFLVNLSYLKISLFFTGKS